MTYLELMVDLHLSNPRQGPGSEKDTLRALEMTGLATKKDLQVADIGCGTGGQTLPLARHLDGHITAVDLFPPFLKELTRRATDAGLSDRIHILEASMDALPFKPESFDLLWSEGAIYNIGFEQGIRQWREYLKPDGFLAVSEITWITQSRPTDLEEFWLEEYAEMDMASGKISLLEQNGYALAGYFHLPPESWIDSYYKTLERSFTEFLNRHNHSEAAIAVARDHQDEIGMYNKYQAYYSYGFYVARKC